jgi:hypothetical protein
MMKRKRTRKPAVAPAGTITLTGDEAHALLCGVGKALQDADPPEDVAPHLSTAIEKLDIAFGFGLLTKEPKQ